MACLQATCTEWEPLADLHLCVAHGSCHGRDAWLAIPLWPPGKSKQSMFSRPWHDHMTILDQACFGKMHRHTARQVRHLHGRAADMDELLARSIASCMLQAGMCEIMLIDCATVCFMVW